MSKDELILQLGYLNSQRTQGNWLITRNEENKTVIYTDEPGMGGLDICIVQPWMTHEEPNAEFIQFVANHMDDIIRALKQS
jgi:hypothetical protein